MQIITVAPIVRGALQGALTYFSKEPIAIGMVVVAPIRTREVPSIVLESREVAEEKSALKASNYAIRKITRAKPKRIWLPTFLRAAETTANFYTQKLGETILALTPKTILDAYLDGTLEEPMVTDNGHHSEIFAIQGTTNARYEEYQRRVRESFVKGHSVFICVPTEEDVERVSEEIGRGIEDYSFSFHSSVTKKRILERWENAVKKEHAILVVGTAQYLSLPRYFKTIILDEEHSHSWKTLTRPLFDQRTFVEEYAKESKSFFIIGAPILRAETHARIADGTVGEFGRIALHARREIKTTLVDPRAEEKSIREDTGKRGMIVITKETREILKESIESGEKVFLLAARKGLAPVTTCGDCGTLVRCPECDTPLVIHKKEGASGTAQVFVCHGCGFMRTPENNVNETCPKCGGWKLQGVGIGIDLIADEISKIFPDTSHFILDGDRAKTRAQAKKIIAQFEKSHGGILIATPMAIPLLETVPNTAVISIDSLFAIPDIRMSERIFSLILALREKTTHELIIQTRADDTTIFVQALAGNLADFSENELMLRKTFHYPPYGTIIKITVRGKRTEVSSEIEHLKVFLAKYIPITSGTMAREPKNVFRMHMILKIAKDAWPEKELLTKLRVLPPHITVEVNPDHLL